MTEFYREISENYRYQTENHRLSEVGSQDALRYYCLVWDTESACKNIKCDAGMLDAGMLDAGAGCRMPGMSKTLEK